MLKLLQKTLIAFMLLLFIPFCALAIGWKWYPAIFESDLQPLYWLTETSSSPWALITCFLLWLLFIFIVKPQSKKQLVQLTLLLAGSVIVSQGIKTVLKSTLEEPRPFVMWLEEKYGIDDEYFYSLPRAERADLIERQIKNDKEVPSWSKAHWQNETGYALPSGHTIFSVCWALLFVGFFRFSQHYLLVSVAVLWAGSVSLSRLVLGMHWPTDLIGGMVVAWVVAIGTLFLAYRWGLIAHHNKSKKG